MEDYNGGRYVRWPPPDWNLNSSDDAQEWDENVPDDEDDAQPAEDPNPEPPNASSFEAQVEEQPNDNPVPPHDADSVDEPSVVELAGNDIPWLNSNATKLGPPKAPDNNGEVAGTNRTGDIGDRLVSVENALVAIAAALKSNNGPGARPQTDRSWSVVPSTSSAPSSMGMVRVESLPQFPKDVPLGKIWETFTSYLQKLEISLSVYGITDPARRAQLLYLAIGDDMQQIVDANGLRPSLGDPECYEKMVSNITTYFLSMTDTAAEHVAFSTMQQEPDEPIVKFYARLKSKVRTCDYTSSQEDRFVRAQLLTGMTNRKLADDARTYNYGATEVIQHGTRAEALASEKRAARAAESFAVESRFGNGRGRDIRGRGHLFRGRGRDFGRRDQTFRGRGLQVTRGQDFRRNQGGRQWMDTRSSSTRPPTKRRKCPNCYKDDHGDNDYCSAVGKVCWRCEGVGHFATACREAGPKKFAQQIEHENTDDQV